jgi:hypothetical protein
MNEVQVVNGLMCHRGTLVVEKYTGFSEVQHLWIVDLIHLRREFYASGNDDRDCFFVGLIVPR